MTTRASDSTAPEPVRRPAVAGTFYPGSAIDLEAMVDELFAAAGRLPGTRPSSMAAPIGLLVPHAGLVYSGVVAAAAWAQLAVAGPSPTVVLLGTNHGAAWLEGIGAWDGGAWRIPTGHVTVDRELAGAIVSLGPPFVADRAAHAAEHSIEVQLPLLHAASPDARIVPLAVSAGRGAAALDAGARLGGLLAERRAAGTEVMLVISSDMAHYPAASACERVTETLLPAIMALDGRDLGAHEAAVRSGGVEGLVCGMCGIDPAVLGLAALRAMGARSATVLASATSADAGGPPDSTVGYLAVRFDG
jgi:AmmeMemoRadiSam system protein B